MTNQISRKWNRVKFEDVADFNIATAGKNYKYTEIEYVDISSVETGILNGTTKYDYTQAPGRAKRIVKSGDTIVANVRPNRRSFYYFKNPADNLIVSTGFTVITPKEDSLNKRYAYYLISNQAFTDYLINHAKGAAYPAVDTEIFKKAQVLIPDLQTQKQIADVLSAYDDLIENNNRRIKILEETAQKIYKEWFVNFRFPGYEKGKMIYTDTGFGIIPEGWEVKTLDECIAVHRGKSYTSEELVDEGGLPFINLKCVNRYGGFRKDGIKGFSGKYKDTQKVEKGDIVMAVTDMTQERMIVARCARVPSLKDGFGVISMDLIKIEPKDNCEKNFLYSFFRWSAFADEVKNHANGANVLHLNPQRVSNYEFVCPTQDLQKLFSKEAECMFDEIDSIQLMNENLKKSRDLLIPQLVSGKLELKHDQQN